MSNNYPTHKRTPEGKAATKERRAARQAKYGTATHPSQTASQASAR